NNGRCEGFPWRAGVVTPPGDKLLQFGIRSGLCISCPIRILCVTHDLSPGSTDRPPGDPHLRAPTLKTLLHGLQAPEKIRTAPSLHAKIYSPPFYFDPKYPSRYT